MGERQLSECTWMRDYALQQADEARAHLQAQCSELKATSIAADSNEEVARDDMVCARREAEKLRAQIEQLVLQHRDDLRQQSQMSHEEIEYLKKKNDEKDRRLEVLTCERNALRFESTEKHARKHGGSHSSCSHGASEELPDLEEGQ